MAWLLAGVVEPGDPPPVHGGDRGDGLDGGGGGDDVDSVPKTHAEIEVEGNGGKQGEDADVETAAASRFWEESATEVLARNAAKRKRAASFLHQLLITVRTRCVRVPSWQSGLRVLQGVTPFSVGLATVSLWHSLAERTKPD